MADTTENEELLEENAPSSYTTETQSESIGSGQSVTAPGIGLGRRKSAVARVRLVPGSGEWKINGRTLENYGLDLLQLFYLWHHIFHQKRSAICRLWDQEHYTFLTLPAMSPILECLLRLAQSMHWESNRIRMSVIRWQLLPAALL